MTKRLIALFTTLTMSILLTACGQDNNDSNTDQPNDANQESVANMADVTPDPQGYFGLMDDTGTVVLKIQQPDGFEISKDASDTNLIFVKNSEDGTNTTMLSYTIVAADEDVVQQQMTDEVAATAEVNNVSMQVVDDVAKSNISGYNVSYFGYSMNNESLYTLGNRMWASIGIEKTLVCIAECNGENVELPEQSSFMEEIFMGITTNRAR